MKKSIFVLALLSASPAAATEWHVYGARAMAMGGAGVAIAQGPVGAYWNPAGLGQEENPSGVQIPVGAHLAISGPVLQGANDLNQVAKDCFIGPTYGTCSQSNINSALSNLNQAGNGVRGDAGLGVDLKIKSVAFFVNELAYVAGRPFIDNSNTAPATINNNQSRLNLSGIGVTEIGVGYGQELPWVPGLLLGANLKGLVGRVGYTDVFLASGDPGTSSLLGKFKTNYKQNVQPGIDVGALWEVNRTFSAAPMRPRVGISARNINNPQFRQPSQAIAAGERTYFSLQGNARAGVAISPLHFWNIAADADITRNLTPLSGVASQMAGVGTEINVFNRPWLNIPLRAGLSRNLAQKGSRTMVSAGAGLNFLHFVVDLAVASSPAEQRVQSQNKLRKLPNEISAAVQVGFLFGGEAAERPREKPREIWEEKPQEKLKGRPKKNVGRP